MRFPTTLFIALGLFLSLPLPAATIHVPADQPTIQAGIDAALDGDTVLVADGTYSGEGNRDIDFHGKAIKVRSENGAANCIVDCQGSVAAEHRGFYFHSGEDEKSVVQGFTIRNGEAGPSTHGGAIFCNQASPTIKDNLITGNSCDFYGGGICCFNSSAVIDGNTITANSANWGGGISCRESEATIRNNTISGNTAENNGGGIFCDFSSSLTVLNNVIAGNFSDRSGGGIACYFTSTLAMTNCTVASNNTNTNTGGIYSSNSTVLIENSIVWGNAWDQLRFASGGTGVVTFSDIQNGWSGEGNIDIDPLFVSGPLGEYCLSHLAAGQAENSPCIDTGDPLSDMVEGTTRTDFVEDAGVVDMGSHYPLPVYFLVTCTGPAYDNPPHVRVFPTEHHAAHEYQFQAYGPDHYGVNVSCGDIDGDRLDEILTGPGPGDIYGPHVRGFNKDGSTIPGLSFLAYGTNKYGANVTAGDLDGDGTDEIITGAGPGAVFGPHVRAWTFNGTSGVAPYPGVSYFAYGTPKWGVNVSAGDIDGDGFDEIVSGAGPGAVYGPHVRGWNVDGNPTVSSITGVSFFAYGTLKYGVNVSCGDVDGDGIDEIVTGAGPGAVFGPHVRGWDFDDTSVTPLPGFSFFAWLTGSQSYGVNVFAGADLNGNGRDELVAGRGPDPTADTEVKVFTYDGIAVTQWISLEAFPEMTHGTNVAAGRF